ncbi:DUF2851 family protein [Salinibacter grassmerensis]|uniref:DUF2851 family protein n=1 Tax=Salinibacter grassmerensis TaxID=3040353 RepID=UPI0021E8067D|nr:DUF2851 family protein [Salinibacter grassmerensis]
MPTLDSPLSDPDTLHEPAPETATVPEALVQDLWAQQRFETEDLATTDGDTIDVCDPGQLNADAGPDFQNAHVRIGGIDWRGQIEVHTTSGGWFRHEHHTDPRFNSVVLHVTLHADMWTGGLLRADESPLPELALYPRLDTPLRELLYSFRTRADDDALPCASRWDEVPAVRRQSWIRRLGQDRLTEKRDQLPEPSETPPAEILHQHLFGGLGYAKNDAPMTTLARRTPPKVLRPLDAAPEREALLLGTAGLLPEPGDLLEADRPTADYAMALRDHFRRLQVGLDVRPMASTAWTFFRLRPNNFPPLRIAQAAAWYGEGGLLRESPVSTLRTALGCDTPVATLREALAASPPAFWRTHYHLTKRAAEHDPSLGTSRRDTLLVNAVVPVLLQDAERRGDTAQADAALDVLRALPASQDHVVRRFQDLGTDPESAYDAQGLHELYKNYCSAGGCLDCRIGQHLLSD